MEMQYANIDTAKRRAYERFFFETICSMRIADRSDFTVDLPQVEGLYFTSVQDTVERLTELTGRLSKFQWRNCIFAPMDRTVRPGDAEEVFKQLKSKAPFLFVRSYVYLIFIRLNSYDTSALDLGEALQPAAVSPRTSDYKIYYWNTNYQVRENPKRRNLFGDPGTTVATSNDEHADSFDGDDARFIENDPQKLFVVKNPSGELKRIQDANSDIIDAFRAFNGSLPLVEQTERYLAEVSRALEDNKNARVLVEGPARSGKTILAMSLLTKYPKSKILLMNWYFYEALLDAFKIWSTLSIDEITDLFVMSQQTRMFVESCSFLLACQADQEVLNAALWAMENFNSRPLPRWSRHGNEWRVVNVPNSVTVGDLVPVIKGQGTERVMQIRRVTTIHADRSATVETVSVIPEFAIPPDQTARLLAQLLECRDQIEARSGWQYIGRILRDIADALHNSSQRFFHHDINPRRTKGCWIKRGNPTSCWISDQDLVICDEVQRLGEIPEFNGADRFDETQKMFKHPRSSFFCGDDFQMLNPDYDRGVKEIKRIAAEDLIRIELPDSIGVPAEVGELIKYLLNEHSIPNRSSEFEIQLLHNDDIRFVELFEADSSTKKHYAIPNHQGFYRHEPYIQRTTTRTQACTPECTANCEHTKIPMLDEEKRKKLKFFCSEAIMPNYALSAYELISREIESVYLKIPAEIGLRDIQRPMTRPSDARNSRRNWKKQHLYVLMTRATMKLVINIEDRELYEYLDRKNQAAQ